VAVTREAMHKFASELALSEPDTIIFVSPHMVHYPHLFNILAMGDLFGSFANFGYSDFEWHGHNDVELAYEIADRAEDEGLPAILYNNREGEYEVDHGTMVPLYFIQKSLDFPVKVLPIGYCYASRSEHYTFGQIIAEVANKKSSERIAIIASGEYSPRLKEGSSEAQKNTGGSFDSEIISLIKKGDEYSIVNMSDDLVDNAGECGYRSILVLLGALSGTNYKPEVYSYEGPFGVGYMVANMGIALES